VSFLALQAQSVSDFGNHVHICLMLDCYAVEQGVNLKLLALSKNIKLDWKGLTGSNTSLLQTFVKHGNEKFYNIVPWS